MVLHDLNQACRYVDHLIAIKSGQIVASGAPQAVMTTALVQEVFALDCQIHPDPIVGTPMCIPISQKSRSERLITLGNSTD